MEALCVAIQNNLFNRFVLRTKDADDIVDGQILGKMDNKIHLVLFDYIETIDENQLYDIDFQINRLPYQAQHKALDFVQHHKLFDLLIENTQYSTTSGNHENGEDHSVEESCNEDQHVVDLNEEQRLAVDKITEGSSFPLPYLLYGPAGTGKTKTLVSAIRNIVETSTNNILVCAQSNAACDEIAQRLCKHFNKNEIFRMYAMSQRPDKISPLIQTISNAYDGFIDFPPLHVLYKFRVIICTLSTAVCLTRAHFDPYHFSYVIIDECASTPETMALIPIAGLCTSVEKVHANIVLAGDPKQLDAVIKSEWASKLGYNISWLQHLFNFPLYKRDATTGKFNSKYITQLVKNYRNHPAILHIPNQLFYDGALEAEASPEPINLNIQGHTPNFPIIFKSIQGICQKDDNDTRFNIFSVF